MEGNEHVEVTRACVVSLSRSLPPFKLDHNGNSFLPWNNGMGERGKMRETDTERQTDNERESETQVKKSRK